MKLYTMMFVLAAASSTAAVSGTGGPVDCVTHEGCPTTTYQAEAGAPVIDWPEFVTEDEVGPVADGVQCKVTIVCEGEVTA